MSNPITSPPKAQTRISRRSLITGSLLGVTAGALSASVVAPSIASLSLLSSANHVTGSIVGAPALLGHMPQLPSHKSPTRTLKTGIAIVGGGVSGLSAGWHLARTQFTDYMILELHSSVGGNALSGTLGSIPHPWGAHYLPIPNRESEYVRDLLLEMGTATSTKSDATQAQEAPTFQETSLVAEPSERLFHHGKWHNGLVPTYAVSAIEIEQHTRFRDLMSELREQRGADGRPAFAIPIELSSTDAQFTKYDSITFSEFITDHGFNAPTLLWYLEYCCKDDYGALPSEISAWAGIHYFAGRRGWSANAGEDELLTWPEGNGRLVSALASRSTGRITSGAVTLAIHPGNPHTVTYYDASLQEVIALEAQAVIVAIPQFSHKFLIKNVLPTVSQTPRVVHHPWMVANLLLNAPPDGTGQQVAWDNVLYGAASLGYVSATHQNLTTSQESTVLTYYLPLPSSHPHNMRTRCQRTDWESWTSGIYRELMRPHPHLLRHLRHVDVWIWGHGMAAAMPGYLWGSQSSGGRPRGCAYGVPGLFRAHSDMSGISLFEEAQYHGITAAHEALRFLQGAV